MAVHTRMASHNLEGVHTIHPATSSVGKNILRLRSRNKGKLLAQFSA